MQERFDNTSPSDHEGAFIKAGDSATKEGLRVEEATGGSLARGVRLIFTGGPHQPRGCLQRAECHFRTV